MSSIQGIISKTISAKTTFGQAHDTSVMLFYSGSFYNGSGATLTIVLEMNTFSSGATNIKIDNGQKVLFHNLPIVSIDLQTGGPVIFLATEASVPLKDIPNLIPEIRYD